MKIKLDENIPASLVELLTNAGHGADTVAQEGLTGRQDPDVWRASQKAGCFPITQDLDFSDVRQFRPGTHHGLMLVRLSEPGRRRLTERLRQLVLTESLDSWKGCFVVVSDRKIRVRKPEKAK